MITRGRPCDDTAELFDLTGKVVIVTGSTKGIGRAMVEGLARAGASVVVSSRKQDLCDEVAEEIADATGAEVLGLACHVGEWDAIPGFVDGVLARFGRIDGLVNNAGINPARIGPADMTLDYWRKVFSVNVEGPLRTEPVRAPRPCATQGGGQHREHRHHGRLLRRRQHLRVRLVEGRAAQPHQEHGDGVGAVERPREHALARSVHERDDGRRRQDPARLPRARRRRHVHEADRRSRRRSSGRSAT